LDPSTQIKVDAERVLCEAPCQNIEEPSSYSIPAGECRTPPRSSSFKEESISNKKVKRPSPHFGNQPIPKHYQDRSIGMKEDKTRSETNQHELIQTPTRLTANKGSASKYSDMRELKKYEYRDIKINTAQSNLSDQCLRSVRTDQPERQRISNYSSVKSSAQKSMAVPKTHENNIKKTYRPELGSVNSFSFSRQHVNKRRSKLIQKKKRDIKEERKAQLELDPEAKKIAIAQNFKNIKNRIPNEPQFKAPSSKTPYGSNLIINNRRKMMLLKPNKENNPTY
jgi:hypothetical protein